MDFEWDEEKRLANIEKHSLDFLDADLVFGNAHLVGLPRIVGGEQRWLAIGTIENVFVTTIFTRRGDIIRIISMRSARHGERKRHQAVFGS
jgi:uncharacterized DUF497 family protein